jgi:hypothetical protein
MIDISKYSILSIVSQDKPIYIYGAFTTNSLKVLSYLVKHGHNPENILDENFQFGNETNKYEEFTNIYKEQGIRIIPHPTDIMSIKQGIVIIAEAEKRQRKWIRYFSRNNYHIVYDAFDIVFYPEYERCINDSVNYPLLRCKTCHASFRNCPVRENWYASKGIDRPSKTIRHIAIKPGFICNLKCKYCCEFLPKFEGIHKRVFDPEALIKDIKKLSDSVEYIKTISLSGGDVMLNSSLAQVINEVLSIDNIGEFYTLTNGTYIPHQDILNAFQENAQKIRVVINDYSINGGAIELRKELNRRGIKNLLRPNEGWYDLNDLTFKSRSVQQLKVLYEQCDFDCNSGYYYVMTEGRLNTRCGVANAIMYYLQNYNVLSNDWIDVRSISKQEIANELTALEDREYLDTCNYCRGCTVETRNLEPAKNQMPNVANNLAYTIG